MSGYDTSYVSLSLGTLFFIIAASLLAVVLGGATYFALHISKVLPQMKSKIGGIILSNLVIRFLIEGYFEFTLSLAINI